MKAENVCHRFVCIEGMAEVTGKLTERREANCLHVAVINIHWQRSHLILCCTFTLSANMCRGHNVEIREALTGKVAGKTDG